MVAVSLLARCAGSMAIESLLSNLNEPRNNIVRGVSVSPGVRGFFVVFGTSRSGRELDAPPAYNHACNSDRACNIRSVASVV